MTERDQIRVDMSIYRLGTEIDDLADFIANPRTAPLVAREYVRLFDMAAKLGKTINSLAAKEAAE